MSNFWSWWIIVIVAINFGLCIFLLFVLNKNTKGAPPEGEIMPHVFDGVEEYNNPMPHWWTKLFWGTLVFGAIYLALYPGLGNYKGALGWTSANQYTTEVEVANKASHGILGQMAAVPVGELATDPQYSAALDAGSNIFKNNCALCHGSDAKGAKGFPNLVDNDWLWGDSDKAIVASIANGRTGVMPAKGLNPAMTDAQIDEVVQHVLSLSGKAEANAAGSTMYASACAACHGAEGKGNIGLAPNLSDNVWLYGGDVAAVRETIAKGRNGAMPAHKDILTAEQIHVVAAYVKSLSVK